jgi:hypothetical protein
MKTIYCILLLLVSPHLQADDTFSILLPECAARLETRTVEAKILTVRSDCPLSLNSLSQLLDAGLRSLYPGHSLPIHSIYLGRLMNYPEWSQTLAKSAAQSPGWNSLRGRPSKTGENDNQRIRQLLNGPAYPQALKPVFAQYGLTACIANVEKVLVFKAKDIFQNISELPGKISPAARLPVDAQIWLNLYADPVDCSDPKSAGSQEIQLGNQ